MQRFVDNAGRTWVIQINVAAVKRVRGLLDVDLYKLVDDRFAGLKALISDPVQLIDVVYVLCKAEADAQGISDEQFGTGFSGDTLHAASQAFLSELIDFFPDPRVRAGIRRVIELTRTVNVHMMDEMEASLSQVDPMAVARRLIASSGTAPGSLESTPDLLPFES